MDFQKVYTSAHLIICLFTSAQLIAVSSIIFVDVIILNRSAKMISLF
jgi:hypothetical protein